LRGGERASIIRRFTVARGAAMPDWLVQMLIQYPIVVVIGFVAWYAYGEIKEVYRSRIQREEQLHAAGIAELKAAHQQSAAEMKAEVARLQDSLRDELKKLGKKVDELTKRLGA
jgi:hypothetical protein